MRAQKVMILIASFAVLLAGAGFILLRRGTISPSAEIVLGVYGKVISKSDVPTIPDSPLRVLVLAIRREDASP